MNKKTIRDIDVSGKRVLLRTDYNVQVDERGVLDDRRLRESLPTIETLRDAGAKIVIEHTSAPWFLLTVTLTPQGNQTHVAWEQQFESPAVAEKLAAVCRPGNDQNLERLEALLVSKR